MKPHVDENRIMKTFARKIVRHRIEKNMTQLGLSELVGIHVNTLSNIERDSAIPSLVVAMKISFVLDISIDDVMNTLAYEAMV
jgi:DNA-binding XRE family transcriptional regulator